MWVDKPVKLPEQDKNGTKNRKSYKVQIKYRNGANGKICLKTLKFGEEGNDFVDNKDEKRRGVKFCRLSHQSDPFHPNYYRLHLLNTEPSVDDAYINFLKKVFKMSDQK